MPDFLGPLSHHTHSRKPVSYAYAQKWINAYTARSQQHPHMHPDAQLSRKMTFGTNGASGGITLTQLRKVSRGMGGERVTPEPEAPPESKDDRFRKKRGKEVSEEDEAGKDGTKEDEWQDGDEWAEGRGGMEVGEVGERSNYVGEVPEGEAPEVEELPAAEAAELLEEKVEEVSQEVNKEERKMLKKEKRKAEKQEKEAKRRKAAEE